MLSCVRYHNIINLLKGFKLLQKENNLNLKFVFALQILDKKYFNEIKKFVETNFDKDEIIFLHNLNNKFLVNLYKNAKFYIFSSYCEVFGLTSLEAMSQGCPVIISNRSALMEINSDALMNIAEIKKTKIESIKKNKKTVKSIKEKKADSSKKIVKKKKLKTPRTLWVRRKKAS